MDMAESKEKFQEIFILKRSACRQMNAQQFLYLDLARIFLRLRFNRRTLFFLHLARISGKEQKPYYSFIARNFGQSKSAKEHQQKSWYFFYIKMSITVAIS